MVLGSAVHKALAWFYRCLHDGEAEPAIDKLVSIAGASISKAVASDPPVLFADGEDGGTLVDEATRLLTAFLAQGYRPAKVVAVEVPFSLPLVHPETGEALPYEEHVVGAIDLVAEDQDGGVVVLDHKITGRVDKTKTERPDMQMAIYSYAARELFGADSVTLRYQDVVRTKSAKVVLQDVQRVPRDEAEGIEAVASGLELIHAAVGSPGGKTLMGRRRSWRCGDCGWRTRCARDRT